jgi:hypothetical protein
VTDTTTPTPDAPTEQENDWADPQRAEARYKGLQATLNKRMEALYQSQAQIDSLRVEKEAMAAELAALRQPLVDADEEAAALAQWETLKERFGPPGVKPRGVNPPRTQGGAMDWTAPQESAPRRDVSEGYPT